jgi:hypothetical protein
MKRFTRKKTILLVTAFTFVLAGHGVAAAPDLPNPVLAFIGQEHVEIGGKQMIRYNYEVANKASYPDELFAPAPNLAPCGTNTKAARTWVDIYDQSGKKLNGFCNLTKSADLSKVWFAMDSTAVPPSWVYIELTDRQTNTKYKSNLAETTQ